MQVISFGATDIGKVREANEDAYLIDSSSRIFAVADGLGGLPGGAQASNRTIELLQLYSLSPSPENSGTQDLVDTISRIDEMVTREGDEAYPFTGMGSTLSLARIFEDQLQIAHVGDSAIFLIREAVIKKLTTDHTLAQEAVDEQGESIRASLPPSYADTLTNCIGLESRVPTDTGRHQLQTGDRVLLCTDGLSKYVSEEKLLTTITNNPAPENAVKQLIQLAMQSGGSDNITAIVIALN